MYARKHAELHQDAKEKLLARRAELLRVYREAKSEEGELGEARESDPLDRGADAGAIALRDHLAEAELAELGAIDAALARIERGTYGRCQGCGGAIEERRLAALPEATRCGACAGLRR